MSAARPRLVLASASPRRRELLQQIGLHPDVVAADIDEAPRIGESADACVLRLARAKAAHVRERLRASSQPEHAVVLAADTGVIDPHKGRMLGKPADRRHGLAMLATLSAATHTVVTAVCVGRVGAGPADLRTASVVTEVSFAPISRAMAEHYWQSGEPRGKAGGYAIQGRGALFVRHLGGSYSNVVGLPLFETAALLRDVGVTPRLDR